MTIYNIGPGETYETFTALEAAVVLVGDDIVDGIPSGIIPFLETWTLATSGTLDHLITLQNAIIDGEDTRSYCIDISNKEFLTLDSLNVRDATSRNIWGEGSSSNAGILLRDIISTGGVDGIWIRSKVGLTFDTVSVSDCSDQAIQITKNGAHPLSDIILSKITIDGCTGALQIVSAENINISSVDISNATSYGLQLRLVSGTVVVDGITSSADGISDSGAIGFWEITSGTFTLSNITSTASLKAGVRFRNITGAIVNAFNFNVSGSEEQGIWCTDATVSISDSEVSNNDFTGFVIDGTLGTTTLNDSTSNNNTHDGVSVNGGATVILNRHISDFNGSIPAVNTGDAYTAHDTANFNTNFCLGIGNTNTGIAHIDTPTTNQYHMTLMDNFSVGATRAEFWLDTTGGVQTLKNSILKNIGNSYPLITLFDGAVSYPVTDYNAYISDSLTPFYDGHQAGGSEELTFSQWITASSQDVNSYFIHKNGVVYDWYKGDDPGTIIQTTVYNPVNIDGTLVNNTSNLLIDGGLFIVGVNDGNELDVFNYPVFGRAPNIGASQELYHADVKGQVDFEFTALFNTGEQTGQLGLITTNDEAGTIVYYDDDTGKLKVSDGVNTAEYTLTLVSGTKYFGSLQYGTISGQQMRIGEGGSYGTAVTNKGFFPNADDLEFKVNSNLLFTIGDVKWYKEIQ
jgi:hypothetical protein